MTSSELIEKEFLEKLQESSPELEESQEEIKMEMENLKKEMEDSTSGEKDNIEKEKIMEDHIEKIKTITEKIKISIRDKIEISNDQILDEAVKNEKALNDRLPFVNHDFEGQQRVIDEKKEELREEEKQVSTDVDSEDSDNPVMQLRNLIMKSEVDGMEKIHDAELKSFEEVEKEAKDQMKEDHDKFIPDAMAEFVKFGHELIDKQRELKRAAEASNDTEDVHKTEDVHNADDVLVHNSEEDSVFNTEDVQGKVEQLENVSYTPSASPESEIKSEMKPKKKSRKSTKHGASKENAPVNKPLKRSEGKMNTDISEKYNPMATQAQAEVY